MTKGAGAYVFVGTAAEVAIFHLTAGGIGRAGGNFVGALVFRFVGSLRNRDDGCRFFGLNATTLGKVTLGVFRTAVFIIRAADSLSTTAKVRKQNSWLFRRCFCVTFGSGQHPYPP